jgi:hypothetical protein
LYVTAGNAAVVATLTAVAEKIAVGATLCAAPLLSIVTVGLVNVPVLRETLTDLIVAEFGKLPTLAYKTVDVPSATGVTTDAVYILFRRLRDDTMLIIFHYLVNYLFFKKDISPVFNFLKKDFAFCLKMVQ